MAIDLVGKITTWVKSTLDGTETPEEGRLIRDHSTKRQYVGDGTKTTTQLTTDKDYHPPMSEVDTAIASALDDLPPAVGEPEVITESTTARILGLSDVGKMIRCTNDSAVTITIPPQSDVTWTGYNEVYLLQSGTGQVTVQGGSGVTLRTSRSAAAYGRYSTLCVKRLAADEWLVYGDTE